MNVIILDTGLSSIVHGPSIINQINLLAPESADEDDNGHGTLCGSAIKYYSNTNVNFYSIKMLNEEKKSSSEYLIQALDYAKTIDIRIIHMSLSTTNLGKIDELKRIIKELSNSGKIIVASMPNSGKLGFPAALREVIGVDGALFNDHKTYWYNMFYRVQCVADRMPVMFKGPDKTFEMFGGTSKAASMMTANICDILEQDHNMCYHDLEEELMQEASQNEWSSRILASKKEYKYRARTIETELEKEIKNVVEAFIYNKGYVVDKNMFTLYGYQPFLKNGDFQAILTLLENHFNVTLPSYEGIDYTIFDDAVTLCNFFQEKVGVHGV